MRWQVVLMVGLCLGVWLVLAMRPSSRQQSQPSQEQPGDAARGRIVFQRRCTGCHALDENREGPRLRGVFGRNAGSVAGFRYSTGLAHSGLTWTPETLDEWLADPDAMVHENKMSFETPNAAERRDLIAYLQAAGDK